MGGERLCYTFSMTEQKILIVEDSEPLRKVLAEKLQNEKFVVLEASGGREGAKIALEQKPDLIITDIVMFPVDGLDMIKEIRESALSEKVVPIIALTNQNSAEEAKRLKHLNITLYLVKAETSLTEVVKHVSELLKKKK